MPRDDSTALCLSGVTYRGDCKKKVAELFLEAESRYHNRVRDLQFHYQLVDKIITYDLSWLKADISVFIMLRFLSVTADGLW